MQPFASEETLWGIFGKSRSDMVEIVNQHTLTVQAWLSSRSPNAQIFEGRGIKACSTGIKVPLLNLALGCDFPPELQDDEIGAEIEAVKDFFAKRGVRWFWWMSAFPRPAHIGRITEKHGLEYDAPPLPAMAASLLQDPKSYPVIPKNIQVWQA
jgi:hypothetical protein